MPVRLQHTKKYDLFELCNFNRDVKKTTRLEASMKRHGFLQAYPLHCIRNGNGTLRIKAGHHRYCVAKLLQLAVWYVVLDDDATIHELEGSTNYWMTADYMESHIRDGKEAYAVVKTYRERTDIPLQHCIALVAGETSNSGNQIEKFKAGRYTVSSDSTHRDLLADVLDHCFACGVAFAKKSLFVQAVSRCLRAPEFDVERFKARVATNPGLFVKQPTLDAMMSMIEMVYNHKTNSKHRIAVKFIVDKAMEKRSASYWKSD